MHKVLVSACLLGSPVRYDGADLKSTDAILSRWLREERVVSFCPEVAGGLPTPRPPAEIVGGDGQAVLAEHARVRDCEGQDVSAAFLSGAQQALVLCQAQNIKIAILTDRSPSCGSSLIYDGSFTGTRRPGQGVTTALLEQHGIRVFSQHQISQAAAYLASLEPA